MIVGGRKGDDVARGFRAQSVLSEELANGRHLIRRCFTEGRWRAAGADHRAQVSGKAYRYGETIFEPGVEPPADHAAAPWAWLSVLAGVSVVRSGNDDRTSISSSVASAMGPSLSPVARNSRIAISRDRSRLPLSIWLA